ncbi:MAG TPA: phosphoribosylaminoimidazolesuccinocarboxamide synthase [Myxococcota bacterium]|jgi:phosphoribosylaminoimidazole-succinocarboxamide synthase|nr:phosphoribosylaminoimidazolesuccinocarboxamide synthase [Myxococcota bacterium]
MISTDLLQRGLASTLVETNLDGLGTLVRGKVRDSYTDGRTRIIVVSDRISAFDRVLGTIPFKGQVLNRIAAFWFAHTKDVVPNHVIDVPDPAATRCVECRVLPVEMVVRGYLTGVTSTSAWTRYQAGERLLGGLRLPDGMKKNQPFARPVLTPTTKAEHGAHDQNATPEELVASGVLTSAQWDELAAKALALFAAGQSWAAARGLILVDTKYEFGVAPDGRIVVADEVHTPDSSRYWKRGTYDERCARGEEPETLDKEYVRRWLVAQGYKGDGPAPALSDDVRIEAARRYIEAFELVTGEEFVPDLEEPAARLRRNLGLGPPRPARGEASS